MSNYLADTIQKKEWQGLGSLNDLCTVALSFYINLQRTGLLSANIAFNKEKTRSGAAKDGYMRTACLASFFLA